MEKRNKAAPTRSGSTAPSNPWPLPRDYRIKDGRVLKLTPNELILIQMIDLLGLPKTEVIRRIRITENELELILKKARRKIALSLVYGYHIRLQDE